MTRPGAWATNCAFQESLLLSKRDCATCPRKTSFYGSSNVILHNADFVVVDDADGGDVDGDDGPDRTTFVSQNLAETTTAATCPVQTRHTRKLRELTLQISGRGRRNMNARRLLRGPARQRGTVETTAQLLLAEIYEAVPSHVWFFASSRFSFCTWRVE